MLKKIPSLVWALLIAVLLECTVFQYKFYGSLGNEPDSDCIVKIVSGGEWNEDGSITITDNLKLEIADIGKEVDSIKLNISRYLPGGVMAYDEEKNLIREYADGELIEEQGTGVTFFASDEANGRLIKLTDRIILADNPQSQYIQFHLSGKCNSIGLSLYDFVERENERYVQEKWYDTDTDKSISDVNLLHTTSAEQSRSADEQEKGQIIRIEEVVINPIIPFDFSYWRCLLLFLTITFLLYARPKAKYYDVLYEPESKQRHITFAVMILQVAIFCGTALMNPDVYLQTGPHHLQYHELAVAFTRGELYLDDTPPAFLQEMDNPYDTPTRDFLAEEEHADYNWDMAYYNGKYYVYFGVLPVLIFYLPWYLLTGLPFPTFLGIMITGAVFVWAVFKLSGTITQKYFKKKIPYVTWLLSTLLAVNGCGAIMAMIRAEFYFLPILMGVTLSVLGINFWIKSVREDGICTGELVAGCLCMALVAACRPQLIVGSLLIFPIYWDAVFKKRWIFSKKGLGKTVLACSAYLIVAILLMTYNYQRFGSFFDFGANYNLTTNDMTRRGFVFARIPTAIFRYLIQPPNITAKFPYLDFTTTWTSYMGRAISEATFGGFFTVNLLPLLGVALLCKKKLFANKKIWCTAVLTFVLGMFLVCFDAEGAGILPRYQCDFGWLFYITGVLAWFSVWQYCDGKRDWIYFLRIVQNIMFCVGMAYAFLLVFTGVGRALSTCNPSLFYDFYYQFAFWA